jgi:polar amino acid transport system substrate-binding protein
MKARVLTALGVMSLGLMASLTGAQSMMKMGECELYPQKNKMMTTFTPAIAGQLTVEVNLPAPLWYNGDTPDSIKSGAEYCLAANIANRAGLKKVVIKNVAWDGLVAGQTKNFDLALSQISITPARQKVVEFSAPYFYSDIGVMVSTKSAATVDATSIKALRVGVQQGTTGETFARDQIKVSKLKVFPDTPGMFTALQAGQIDVAMTDTSIVLSQAKQSAGKFKVIAQYKTGESYGALFPKGSKNNAMINTIIKDMMSEGTVTKIQKQYLFDVWGGDPTKIPYFKP